MERTFHTFLEIATKMHKFTSVSATPTRISHPQFGLYSARKVVPTPPSADPDEAAGGFWVDSALLLPAVGGRFVVKVKAEIFTNGSFKNRRKELTLALIWALAKYLHKEIKKSEKCEGDNFFLITLK
jgi:hypothetical protein